MRVDTPKEVMKTGNSSVDKAKRLRIKALKEQDKRMLDPISMKNCDLSKLPVTGEKIKENSKNTIRFYFKILNCIHSGLWGTDKEK